MEPLYHYFSNVKLQMQVSRLKFDDSSQTRFISRWFEFQALLYKLICDQLVPNRNAAYGTISKPNSTQRVHVTMYRWYEWEKKASMCMYELWKTAHAGVTDADDDVRDRNRYKPTGWKKILTAVRYCGIQFELTPGLLVAVCCVELTDSDETSKADRTHVHRISIKHTSLIGMCEVTLELYSVLRYSGFSLELFKTPQHDRWGISAFKHAVQRHAVNLQLLKWFIIQYTRTTRHGLYK